MSASLGTSDLTRSAQPQGHSVQNNRSAFLCASVVAVCGFQNARKHCRPQLSLDVETGRSVLMRVNQDDEVWVSILLHIVWVLTWDYCFLCCALHIGNYSVRIPVVVQGQSPRNTSIGWRCPVSTVGAGVYAYIAGYDDPYGRHMGPSTECMGPVPVPHVHAPPFLGRINGPCVNRDAYGHM